MQESGEPPSSEAGVVYRESQEEPSLVHSFSSLPMHAHNAHRTSSKWANA